jgi:hypothetical protein
MVFRARKSIFISLSVNLCLSTVNQRYLGFQRDQNEKKRMEHKHISLQKGQLTRFNDKYKGKMLRSEYFINIMDHLNLNFSYVVW